MARRRFRTANVHAIAASLARRTKIALSKTTATLDLRSAAKDASLSADRRGALKRGERSARQSTGIEPDGDHRQSVTLSELGPSQHLDALAKCYEKIWPDIDPPINPTAKPGDMIELHFRVNCDE
jgi:hypothetical protein